jgi:hypothetical protein
MPTERDVTGRSAAELREELRIVEDELAQLRVTVAGLRAQIGDRSDGARDSAELAAVLTATEEQEALIGILEGRRAELRRHLDVT